DTEFNSAGLKQIFARFDHGEFRALDIGVEDVEAIQPSLIEEISDADFRNKDFAGAFGLEWTWGERSTSDASLHKIDLQRVQARVGTTDVQMVRVWLDHDRPAALRL